MVVKRHHTMDQIAKALGLINSFQIDGLTGNANPTSGARLNLAGELGALNLTALDGKDAGVTIRSQGFGIGNLSLPTPQDPAISLDPYLSHLSVDLHPELFERLAVFAKEAILKEFHGVINKVILKRLRKVVRLTSQKIVHTDIYMDHVHLLQGNEELIRVKDLAVSILDFDTKLPPKQALPECTVVLRSLNVEIEEKFFALVLKAVAKKIPSFVKDLHVELPGPQMVAGGKVKKAVFSTSFRVDLQFETKNNMFGIYFDRFYVPGTNVKLPDAVRNLLLSLVRSQVESRAKGLIEVSNESLMINPWSKVPVKLLTEVSQFAVKDGKILVSFTEPTNQRVPGTAENQALAVEREPQDGDMEFVLAPGPAL